MNQMQETSERHVVIDSAREDLVLVSLLCMTAWMAVVVAEPVALGGFAMGVALAVLAMATVSMGVAWCVPATLLLGWGYAILVFHDKSQAAALVGLPVLAVVFAGLKSWVNRNPPPLFVSIIGGMPFAFAANTFGLLAASAEAWSLACLALSGGMALLGLLRRPTATWITTIGDLPGRIKEAWLFLGAIAAHKTGARALAGDASFVWHFPEFSGLARYAALVFASLWDIDRRDKDGKTALFHAASHGRKDVVECILAFGADPAKADHNGETALHAAAKALAPGTVEVLLEAGVRETQNHAGERPLDIVRRIGTCKVAGAETISVLEKYRLQVEAGTEIDRTLLTL